ncbi:acyl-CoA carboxylase epsilon subunit [Kitasatospora sp. CM 4170]|uniref:Acyl-CoA carboxylase epsilon subunit n=1 Tax=Kitasatospora aburaviensis TaxID=67265 RepID=A0ABW1FAL2_9ACTN|nr:acyl-CoA carboxylase epsilon subunit [Kitasatospora sp. CM 4170]WNM44763.1 acyl-CoA carboxylase epsilon subunit [Kitasatospora sp. CM 4170]
MSAAHAPAGPGPCSPGPCGPLLRVLRGRPTGDELAALTAVLAAVLAPAARRAPTGPPDRPAPPVRWERAEPRPVRRS